MAELAGDCEGWPSCWANLDRDRDDALKYTEFYKGLFVNEVKIHNQEDPLTLITQILKLECSLYEAVTKIKHRLKQEPDFRNSFLQFLGVKEQNRAICLD